MTCWTEEEIVLSLMAVHRERLAAWRHELQEKGVPLDAIEALVALSEEISLSNIQRDVPLIARDLQLTAGTAASH
jgi:hypothetical protein